MFLHFIKGFSRDFLELSNLTDITIWLNHGHTYILALEMNKLIDVKGNPHVVIKWLGNGKEE